jgi:hypothetical protein
MRTGLSRREENPDVRDTAVADIQRGQGKALPDVIAADPAALVSLS